MVSLGSPRPAIAVLRTSGSPDKGKARPVVTLAPPWARSCGGPRAPGTSSGSGRRNPSRAARLRADRRAAPGDDTRAIPLPELERLWPRADIPLRERALWRLLYDSAARADEALRLDVGDLDLANREGRTRTKGGHTRPLHFQTAAARLLARLTAGRDSGPVFLTSRWAAAHRVTPAADLDPASGRARLSYEMAEQLFKRYSGGKTLHQMRHSRLTHLGDQNVSAPLLMAISGHKRLATLQRYVQPSQDAVAALMGASDPERRH
jgi:integrase